jgi:competence protein ComEA
MIQLDRRQQYLIILLIGVILFGAGYRLAQTKERAVEDSKPALERGEAKDDSKTKDLFIHVAGAVARPGVYQLPQGSRIIDAVQKAGPAADADLNSLKLAAPVTDGQTIYVPGLQDAVAQAGTPVPGNQTGTPAMSSAKNVFIPQTGTRPGGSAGGLVNINTADLSQLDTLPGIGPSLAQRIIDYRELNGPFAAIEDIKNVSGIGDKKFDALKDMVTVQ